MKEFIPIKYEDLYLLTYFLQNSAIRNKLLIFNKTIDMEERIKRAKDYCGKNNWRFIYLEPAIEWL